MKKVLYIVSAGMICLLSACSSTTKIVNSWYDTSSTVDSRQVNKVLVSAPVENEGRRRSIEDELVKVMKGKGTASYKVFADGAPKDEKSMKQKLSEEGFDAALVLRLVDISKEMDYVPGNYNTYPSYFGSYWGYYNNSWNGWNGYQDPGHYVENKNYLIETNLYSLKDGKLVWNGVTSTINPSNLSSLISQIASAVHKKMVEQGFIAH